MSNHTDRNNPKTKTIGPPLRDQTEAYNHDQGNALLLNQPDDEVIPVLLAGSLETDSTGQKEIIRKPAKFQLADSTGTAQNSLDQLAANEGDTLNAAMNIPAAAWIGYDNIFTAAVQGFTAIPLQGIYRAHRVSAVATAQTLPIDSRNLHDRLSISMVCSAGTATLVISASPDNTNFITIDSIAAAGTTIKEYFGTTVGATTALSPLAFRYIKIVAGSAGAGNTTTVDVGMK